MNSDFYESAIAASHNGPDATFAAWGGPQQFLESYAEYLTKGGENIYSQLGTFDGKRLPETIDVSSPDGTYSWFFHSHETTEPSREQHGHFHLFVKTSRPDCPSTPSRKPHLIAIELDHSGDLAGFFVPNCWTTQEDFSPAPEIIPHLSSFYAGDHTDLILVSLWISAILRIFSEEIKNILIQRDVFVEKMPPSVRTTYFKNTSISRICEWHLPQNVE